MKRLLLISAPALIALTACEEKTTSFGGEEEASACPHTTENLTGTFLYNKLAADGSGDRTPDDVGGEGVLEDEEPVVDVGAGLSGRHAPKRARCRNPLEALVQRVGSRCRHASAYTSER